MGASNKNPDEEVGMSEGMGLGAAALSSGMYTKTDSMQAEMPGIQFLISVRPHQQGNFLFLIQEVF